MRRPRRIVSVWPGGLIGRVVLVLLAAILMESLAGAVVYEQFELHRADDARAELVADRLTVARRVISTAPMQARPALAEAFSTGDLNLTWSVLRLPPYPESTAPKSGMVRKLRELVDAGGGDLHLTVETDAQGRRAVAGALDTDDGGALVFLLPSLPDERAFILRGALSAVFIAALVFVAAMMLIHVLATPLRHLTAVVQDMDVERDAALVEEGPKDVRNLVRAFNSMQGRIAGMVADRTRSLAAISHDLRTPLARIRLRAGFMPDADARAAIETDLSDMEAMIDSLLAYIRGETDPETPELTDVGSLIVTIAEDASDMGTDVRRTGPEHLTATLRRQALKRAVTNLVDNARRYGAVVELGLSATEHELRITVEDDGPGVPEGELARIVEPFVRLEDSRSRDTGGVGLGLALVRGAAEREGGRLALSNRPTGGLRAEIVLPRI